MEPQGSAGVGLCVSTSSRKEIDYMVWTIAFGIVLGLALFFWVLPLLGKMISSGKFWRFIGYGLLVLFTLVGAIIIFNPEIPIGFGLVFFIPLTLFLIYKICPRKTLGEKEWVEEMVKQYSNKEPK